jgi:hypothetical protein
MTGLVRLGIRSIALPDRIAMARICKGVKGSLRSAFIALGNGLDEFGA